jgi:hypothetical protein
MSTLKERQKELRDQLLKNRRERIQKKEDIEKAELKKRQFDETKDIGEQIFEYLGLK